MNRLAFAPLALALATLAACGTSGSGNSSSAAPAGGKVVGKAAPAGTTWAQTIVETPEGGYRMGNPDAPIKLIEFGSYTCPHCRDFTEESHEVMERDYVNSGKVSFEYRNFIRDPLDLTVALIARCGGKDAFFPLSLQFFMNQEDMIKKIQSYGEASYTAAMQAPADARFGKLAELAGLMDFAKQRGIPDDKLRACLADSKNAETIAANVEKYTNQYQIEGTPTIVMNGTKLDNVAAWSALQERLKAAGL
ncbi:thioredoxin domain-containing protein [Sphingobium nicotianae]|uniref:DsbA family protein n=1 Tax=Sphingobium nicotianae TaxID=2782607 RepID=A0A9X1D9Q6_9SPHN|nr:thioredoxin domain-containing protein [Sphingobium nicotianae]MBT2185972.1 DsbA family protein [Sphingobium nicotianae]